MGPFFRIHFGSSSSSFGGGLDDAILPLLGEQLVAQARDLVVRLLAHLQPPLLPSYGVPTLRLLSSGQNRQSDPPATVAMLARSKRSSCSDDVPFSSESISCARPNCAAGKTTAGMAKDEVKVNESCLFSLTCCCSCSLSLTEFHLPGHGVFGKFSHFPKVQCVKWYVAKRNAAIGLIMDLPSLPVLLNYYFLSF